MSGIDRIESCGSFRSEFSISQYLMELMNVNLRGSLERMELMCLCDYLKRVSQTPFSILRAVDLMLQIAEGVNSYHGMNVVDRDFNSGNVLVIVADPEFQRNPKRKEPSLTVMIVDFGLSKVKNDSANSSYQTADVLETWNSTTKWMAPETSNFWQFDERPSDRFHPKKLDVYSFAIICSEILSGEEPYSGVPLAQILPRVRDGLRPSLPEKIPRRLAALIEDCWSGDFQLRPEFAAICSELRFIKELLLQGHNLDKDIKLDLNLDLESVEVQGPWGGSGNDGRMFMDGIFTCLKRIVVHYDHRPTNIWYLELEYVDVDGTSFVVGHGKKASGDIRAIVDIGGPSEYLVQIEGSFGTSITLENRIVVQSLTFRTNKETYGPFGREEGMIKFKSDYGRIVGLFGQEHDYLYQIGCLVLPSTTITSSTL